MLIVTLSQPLNKIIIHIERCHHLCYSSYMKVSFENRNNLAFQSKIKMVTPEEFKGLTSRLNPKKHEIRYPWQPENTKTGKKLFTTKIMDCIAGLVIGENDARMFHLVTASRGDAKRHHLRGFNINKIRYKLLEKVNTADENLHAFIIGGFKSDPKKSKYNWTRLDKIKKIFEENEIPYTILGGRKDVHYYGRYSVMYSHKDDTVYITNSLIDNCFLNKDKEMEILEDGKMRFHTYKREQCSYSRKKHTGTVEDFMNSQFQEIKLSKFDEWI